MTEHGSYSDVSGQELQRAPELTLKLSTDKGRGVFTKSPIKKGTIVEVSPVLVFTPSEVEQHTSQTVLQHYTYHWPSSDGNLGTQAIALGLGSMFNHSTLRQNVGWRRAIASQCLIYTALVDIEAGEELCISYGNGRLWFRDADASDEDESEKLNREINGLLNVETEDDL